jgi:hypothetical protein
MSVSCLVDLSISTRGDCMETEVERLIVDAAVLVLDDETKFRCDDGTFDHFTRRMLSYSIQASLCTSRICIDKT